MESLEDRRLLAVDVTYHGGPLLQNVQIESVFYGQSWTTDANLQQLLSQTDGFFQYFPTSPYMNVLKQYNVGDGSFLSDLVIPQNPGGQTIDDSQIRQILDSEIAAHQLPAPTANSLYVFFTAPGVVVTDNGQNSVRNFAGYHDTFKDSAGAPVYYVVVPYPTGGVANVQLSIFQQMTVILSHEVSEGITDPDTQTGWFDPRNGEIGDIAEGHIGVLDGYAIQGVWSQAQNQIVIPSDTSGTTLQVNGVPVQATAGQAFTSIVATITGAPAGSTASSFTATIDWGNGVTSAGTITADPNGGFDVTGTNTYNQAGSFSITVTVHNPSGAVVGTALTSASVASASTTATLAAKGTVLSTTAGQQFSGVVATFTDANANGSTSSLSATIDWGDGTTSTGTISVDPNGGFDVSGTHTYATTNQHRWGFPVGGSLEDFLGNQYFVVTVTIHDSTSGATGTALSLAKVASAPPVIIAKGENLSATAGQSFSGVVATFTDVNSTATASQFTATIDWGDGTTSAGTVTADPNGGFDVTGTHTYTTANDWFGVPGGWGIHFGSGNRHFVVTVTVTDTQGDKATAQSLATVAATAPNIAVTAQNIQATAGQSFSGVVATFTAASTSATAANFTATINWGDGTTSTGTVTADPKGGFDVSGTHTYTLANDLDSFGQDLDNFVLTVTVKNTTTSDVGTAQSLAQVTPASAGVQASGTIINAVFRQAFSGTVATFTPVSSGASPSSFTATINWGDGTTSTGTIVADPNGGFDVTGSHTYGGLGGGSFDGGRGSGTKAFLVAVTIENTTNNGVAEAISLASATPTASSHTTTAPSLTSVALDFLQSAEYYTSLITKDYQQLLGRTPSSAEAAGWVNAMQHGLTDTQALVGFLTSPEYYSRAGDNTKAWVDALYHDVLNRTADSGGEASWTQALASGTSQASVALDFLMSQERDALLVRNDYQQYLGRAASAAEVAGWVNSMQHGATSEQIAADFLGSQEYFQAHNASTSAWLSSVYQIVLSRQPDQSGYQSWLALLGQ